MADVTGARGTSNVTQSIRKVDMATEVLELEPDAAPLLVLTSRLNTQAAFNPEFSWQEDKLRVRFDAIGAAGAANNSATTLTIVTPSLYAQYDMVKVTRTGESMRVVSVNTGALTITVVRGVGGGAAAINNNDELLIGASAQPEGDTSKPARSGNPTKVTNYTQIVRTPFESTETLRHSDTFIQPNDWDRQANHAGIEHKKGLEYMFWLGRPSEDLTGSQPLRTSAGVFYYIATNITAAGGTLSESSFWGALRPGLRYGAQSKVLFCSRLVVDVLQGYPRGKLQVIQNESGNSNPDTYGLNVRKFQSAHGEINVVTHNLFEGATYGGYAALLDLAKIKKRVLQNDQGSRDTHIRQMIQAPDADTRKDEYLTECGVQFGNEQAHALITGITG